MNILNTQNVSLQRIVTAASSNPTACFIINGKEILLQQHLHPSTSTDSTSFTMGLLTVQRITSLLHSK
jgi:hypothetical protein